MQSGKVFPYGKPAPEPCSSPMVKTGLSIPDALSFLAILLPVIPIIIIFLRRTWQQDMMIFMSAISLLSIIQNLVISVSALTPANITFVNNIFGLSEFVLLLYLFRLVISTPWIREVLHAILISFVSVSVTIYALHSTAQYAATLNITAAFILLLVAIIALLQLIRDKQLFIFQSPMFWIAGGNICYFTMFILTGFVGIQGNEGVALQHEKLILLSVINGIRYLFFIAAAWIAQPRSSSPGFPLQ
jgi:hypothetical protein